MGHFRVAKTLAMLKEGDHQDLRANPLQKGGDDVTPTSPSSSASTSPSPHQGPITISIMRKIHMGLSQDDQVNHGLFTLFTWAKEISKIRDDAWRK